MSVADFSWKLLPGLEEAQTATGSADQHVKIVSSQCGSDLRIHSVLVRTRCAAALSTYYVRIYYYIMYIIMFIRESGSNYFFFFSVAFF